MIAAPTVLYPMTNWVAGEDNKYYTDSLNQIISGSVPSVIEEESDNFYISVLHKVQIMRNGVTSNFTSFSDGGVTVGSNSNVIEEIPWSFDTRGIINFSVGTSALIVFKTVKKNRFSKYIEDESAEVSINVEIISEDTVSPSVLSTSTLEVLRSKNQIKLKVSKDSIRFSNNAEFAGINFYVSNISGGGSRGYVRMNNTSVTEIDEKETLEEILTDSFYVDSASGTNVRTIKTKNVEKEYYTFTFNKEVISKLIQNNDFPNVFLADGDTLDNNYSYFFVVSVIAFDNVLNTSVESLYSTEKEAKFIDYSLDTKNLPLRSRESVLTSLTKDLVSNNKNINTSGGSVFRDMLDPISLEFEKFYLIQDFVFTCNSINTLVAFDDADGDGVSDPVESNLNKIRLRDALQLTTNDALQLLIDEQFDKLAANRGLVRRPPTRAKGFATFYTKIRPESDIRIPSGITINSAEDIGLGIRSTAFRTVSSSLMDVSNISYYYNPVEQRYEVQAEVEAIQSGTVGNVPSGFLTSSSALGPSVQVTNDSAITGGSNQETNQHLADRIKLSSISLDAGTPGGYANTVLSVPGVEQVRVEEAGDRLMLRDYDKTEKRHIGGKVDIYIKGSEIVQTIDRVSFKYEYPKDVIGNNISEQLKIVSSEEMRLKTINNNVSSESPIVSVSSVRNATRGRDYDITGIEIVGDGDSVILEKNAINNEIGMSTFDIIEMSYKYRSSNSIILENPPVDSIVSVEDAEGNEVDPELYELVKTDDPLDIGESSIAKNALRFNFTGNEDINEFIDIEGEEVDLVLASSTPLNSKGVEGSTIVITSLDGDTTYLEDVDYKVILGNSSIRTEIELLPNSKIRPGSRVSVSYTASMNFKVTYRYNRLVSASQEAVDDMKHSCADTVIKQATLNYIDLGFTVYKKITADAAVNNSLLLSRIKTAINNHLSRMKMGETLTQSSLVKVVSSVEGVSDVKIPLTKMSKRNGSFIPLENLGSVDFELYQKLSGKGVPSYVSVNSVLEHMTSDNGGPDNLFRGVYEDNVPLDLVPEPYLVSKKAGSSYIFSDGRILVSTFDGSPPQSKNYKASYYVSYPENENIVGDIVTSEIEYLDVDQDSLSNVIILKEENIKRGL